MSEDSSLGGASLGSLPDDGSKPVVAEWKNRPLVEWDAQQVCAVNNNIEISTSRGDKSGTQRQVSIAVLECSVFLINCMML